jgi:PAS domain S-box-containing protein
MGLLVTSVVTIFFITFQIQKSTINKLSTEQLNKKSIERVKYFNDFISHRKTLLYSLIQNKDFINFVKNKDGKQYIENIFLSYALTHKEIFQFRYIDLNGNEIIRVDNYNKVNLVKKEHLQNKKTRYYFQDTIKLKKEEYFFSNIDLNVEHGEIQKPIVPTLRIASPVIINDIKYGIIIININVKEFLNYLQDSHLHYVNLIYDDGKIIVNKYNKYNWGRDFKIDSNLYTLFPNLPKNFNKSSLMKTDEFYIKRLDINTKNKIYMVLLVKKLQLYDLLYEDLNQNIIFLLLLIFIFLPISYYISAYIENYYKKELSMKEELQKLRLAIDNSPISVVITDDTGSIEYVNPYFSKITGYSQDEIIGQNPRILKSELTSTDEYEELWDTLMAKKTWKGTFKNIDKKGSEFWEAALITPIFNEENKLTNFLAIKQEISKEIYLKEELKNKEKIMIAQSRHAAMGEMISMIAHQWRQPLSSISMVASNTLMDIEFETVNNDTLKEHSESILKQVKYLSQTIDDFRDFFKPNKVKELIDPKKVVDETLSIMGKTLEKHSINVEILLKHSSRIEVYSRELLQVLINLLKNAQEVLEKNDYDNRRIKISISEEKDTLRIEVLDNGGGIKEELLDKVFEPYFSTKNEKTGTGLGLYMSKTIIEKHLQGIFGVYNDKDGACFYIDLPITEEEKD